MSTYGGPHPLEQFFSAKDQVARQKMRVKLAAKLKAIGGERVVFMQGDFALKPALKEGHLFDLPVILKPGRRNECHRNAMIMWARSQTLQYATGWGLNDGIWRPHSWLVDDKKLFETTMVREKYFGIVLPPIDAAFFLQFSVEQNYIANKMSSPKELRRYPGLQRALNENDILPADERAPLDCFRKAA